AYLRARLPRPADTSNSTGVAILERRVTQVADFEREPNPEVREGARLRGTRSNVTVPMLKGTACLEAIVVGKTTPGVFPAKQVELLQTFADQAVIAIENVRLFTETKEALDQQTATANILRTISESPTDVQPVFDIIAESAARLCEGVIGGVYIIE